MDIYSSASRDEWLRHFQMPADATHFCDGQFIIASDVRLAFFDVDLTLEKTFLNTPDTLIWRPVQKYLTTDDCYQTFTQTMIAKPVHLLLRLPDEQDYTYIGFGACHSYQRHNPASQKNHGTGEVLVYFVEATFHLAHWLRRDLWVRWGGYDAWVLTFNGKEQQVKTWDEVKPYALHLYEEDDKREHLVLHRYEGDSLSIATANGQVFFDYLIEPSGGDVLSRNYAVSLTNYELFDFQVYGGHHSQLPSYYFIPKTYLIQVIQQFVEQGSLSHEIYWEPLRARTKSVNRLESSK